VGLRWLGGGICLLEALRAGVMDPLTSGLMLRCRELLC